MDVTDKSEATSFTPPGGAAWGVIPILGSYVVVALDRLDVLWLIVEVKSAKLSRRPASGTFRPADMGHSQLIVAPSEFSGVITSTFLRNFGSSAAAARLSSCRRMWE